MSLTDTAKQCVWGYTPATAARRSVVKVAMPHLRGKWSPTNAIVRILDVSFIRVFPSSGCLYPPIFRLPHRIVHLLYDVAELDSGPPSLFGSLGNRRCYRYRYAAQIVDVGEQRCARLANCYQAGDCACCRGDHPVADPAGAGDYRAEGQARIQHGVIHLPNDVSHSSVRDGSERTPRRDQRPSLRPV